MNTSYKIFRNEQLIHQTLIPESSLHPSFEVFSFIIKLDRNRGDKFENRSDVWQLSDDGFSLTTNFIIKSNGEIR